MGKILTYGADKLEEEKPVLVNQLCFICICMIALILVYSPAVLCVCVCDVMQVHTPCDKSLPATRISA